MNTQIKGTFSRWSNRSAQWYEDASRYTNYHIELTKYIAPYLSSEENCCELACGSGTLARHLAPLTAHYTANDIDPQSISFCEIMQKEQPIGQLEYILGDWHDVLKEKKFDTVVFSYFGAIIRDWDALCSLAAKKVIAVIPRYSGQEMDEKEKAFSAKSRFHSLAAEASKDLTSEDHTASSGTDHKITDTSKREKKHRSFETMEAISKFLDKRKISYEAIPLMLEFGQPCRTWQDAEEYVKYYYRFETDAEIRAFIEAKFQPADCGYFFSKKKNIAVMIIDMTGTK